MTIGTQMTLGFGAMLALVATLAVVVLGNASDTRRQLSFALQHDAGELQETPAYLAKLREQRNTGKATFATVDTANIDQHRHIEMGQVGH